MHSIEVWAPRGKPVQDFGMTRETLLKKDLFGEVRYRSDANGGTIVRDASCARPWLGWLARRLLRREANVLAALAHLDEIPELLHCEATRLERRYIDGRPLQLAKPQELRFFHDAARLLRRLHAANVVHNDLAKEPNILVQSSGQPALIDFQLGWYARRRNRLFRLMAYDDLRHLLKHKRTYCEPSLTARERRILAKPSAPSRLFRQTVKPVYMFVTRRLLGWADREGATDRGHR